MKLAACVFMVLMWISVCASDPPHWITSQQTIDCTNGCHILHASPGTALTAINGNANLCQSCHNGAGAAADLPINNTDKVDLSAQTGMHHAWDVPAENPAAGAQTPLNPEMIVRLDNGNIICSTCHNQHLSQSSHGGTPRITVPKKRIALGGSGVVQSSGTYVGIAGEAYLIEIQTTGQRGTATFQWSKDNGVTWLDTGVVTSASNSLDDGVVVSFDPPPANYVSGEHWEFTAAWPYLRDPLDQGDNATGDVFCRDCHRSRAMDHNDVQTFTGTPRSHPVGVALNANGGGYDRLEPLDVDGLSQSTSSDSNQSNNLRFDLENKVQCWTCHAVHFATSNSQTVTR